jgi:hypothetical protein
MRGGRTFGLKACSRVIAGKFDPAFLKGRRKAGQQGGTSTICGKPFKYAASGRPLTSHTESRIIETILRAQQLGPGGTLLMSIDWNMEPPSEDACPACQRLICAAAKCMKIFLCKDGEPEDQNKKCAEQ